jgi:predicted dehydrogenase
MNVALIGYGYWGKILEKYIRASLHFNLESIFVNYRTDDIQLILNDKTIEAVFIATPIATHFYYAKLSLEHNKHVFCEKTLCKTNEEFQLLKELAQKRNLILHTNFTYLDSRAIKKIKSEVINLSSPIYINGFIMQNGKFYDNESIYEIIGCHLIAVVLDLFPNEVFEISEIFNSPRRDTSTVCLNSSKVTGVLNFSLSTTVVRKQFSLFSSTINLHYDMLSSDTLIIERKTVNGLNVHKINYNEKDNLNYSLEQFNTSIVNTDSNIDLSGRVIKLIQNIQKTRL